MESPGNSLLSRHCVLALVGLGVALWLSFPQTRHPWAPDEARYLRVAEEMSQQQSWVMPVLNGNPYGQKPPGFFWTLLLSQKLTGHFSAFTAVLPTALAAILVLLMIALIGRRLGLSEGEAALAAVLWATCGQNLWQGRFGQIDTMLLACSMVQMFCLLKLLSEEKSRRSYGMLFFFAAALGTLLKGPVALLPQILAAIVFCISLGKPRRIFRLLASFGWFIYIGVVAAWLFLLARAAGWDYLHDLVFGQTLDRFLKPQHHFQPWHYYLTQIPSMFLPWALFLPPLIYLLVKNRAAAWQDRFLLSWGGSFVLFFSLSSGKRTVYVLAVLPVLALLLVRHLGKIRSMWMWPVRVLLSLLAAGFFMLAAQPSWSFMEKPLKSAARLNMSWQGPVMIMGLILITGVVLSLVLQWRLKRSDVVLTSLALTMAAFFITAMGLLLPALDEIKWAGPMAEKIRREVENEKVVYVTVPRIHPGLVSELDLSMRVMFHDQVPAADLQKPGQTVVYVFPRDHDYQKVKEKFPLKRYKIITGTIGRKNVQVLIWRRY